MMRHRWLGPGGRHTFAAAVTVLALAVAWALHFLTGGAPALVVAFFPALLAITFYSGAVPAVIAWLFSVCVTAYVSGGSFDHPNLPIADRWILLGFALSSALNIAIGAHARRTALEEREEVQRVEEQAQQDVNRAEENKIQALSKLSHDLRTPLSTIVGWAQVLRAQNPPQQMLHGLEVIERNARTQTRIIQELLDGRPPAPKLSGQTAGPAAQSPGPAAKSPGPSSAPAAQSPGPSPDSGSHSRLPPTSPS